MVSVEFEQVSQKGDTNVVKRRVEDYVVVIESSQKYVGVEESGEYRVFTTGVVKSIHNETGTAIKGSELSQHLEDGIHADLPSVIEVFGDEYGIIHGDVNKLAR